MSDNSTSIDIRWFWNDGGPLLILPRRAEPFWEGTDTPSDRRVVQATFRWTDPEAPATDYDRACDLIEHDSVAPIAVGESWGIVLGTVAAQTAAWLAGPMPNVFFAVGVDVADDVSPSRLWRLIDESGHAWRTLLSRLTVDAGGLLLFHAANRPSELTEYPALLSGSNDREGVVIGDGLRCPATAGQYAVDVADTKTAEGDRLTFVRFARRK